jgi:hypothetical protein
MIKNQDLLNKIKIVTGWNEEKIQQEFSKIKCYYYHACDFFLRTGRLPSEAEQVLINNTINLDWVDLMSPSQKKPKLEEIKKLGHINFMMNLNPIARLNARNIMGQAIEKKSLGEERIRVNFSNAPTDDVSVAKQIIAELINMVDSVGQEGSEHGRLKSIALTELESASMWITKFLTYKK